MSIPDFVGYVAPVVVFDVASPVEIESNRTVALKVVGIRGIAMGQVADFIESVERRIL